MIDYALPDESPQIWVDQQDHYLVRVAFDKPYLSLAMQPEVALVLAAELTTSAQRIISARSEHLPKG